MWPHLVLPCKCGAVAVAGSCPSSCRTEMPPAVAVAVIVAAAIAAAAAAAAAGPAPWVCGSADGPGARPDCTLGVRTLHSSTSATPQDDEDVMRDCPIHVLPECSHGHKQQAAIASPKPCVCVRVRMHACTMHAYVPHTPEVRQHLDSPVALRADARPAAAVAAGRLLPGGRGRSRVGQHGLGLGGNQRRRPGRGELHAHARRRRRELQGDADADAAGRCAVQRGHAAGPALAASGRRASRHLPRRQGAGGGPG